MCRAMRAGKNGPAQSSVVEIASHRLRLGCRQAPAPAPHACERRPSATLPARPGRTGLCSTDDAVRISARERATDPVGKESVQLQELANVVVRQRVARKLVAWVLVVRHVVRRADKDARQPPGASSTGGKCIRRLWPITTTNDACRVAREGLSRTIPGPNAEMYAKMNSSGDTARAVDGETDLPLNRW